MKPTTLWLTLIGGLIFTITFYLSYTRIPTEFYEVRDDAIITMSHAVNLVDYGFIGVNPSGDRVEGFSAPVQFFIYLALYASSGISYDIYAKMQTAIFTFLLGGIFIQFFKNRPIGALLLTAFAGIILSHHVSFIQWHGSGMENAITHVLFLSSVLALFSFATKERIIFPLAFVIFLATISRLDSVFHVVPLLIIFAAYWFYVKRSLQGLLFFVVVILLWFGYQVWRYFYFGDILPNTAYAQNISVANSIQKLFFWDRDYINQSFLLSKRIFSYHGGYLLLVFMPLWLVISREKSVFLLMLLIMSLVLTSYFNPFFFGETRLDPTRSTTQLSIVVALGISVLIFFIENLKHLLWILPASSLAAIFTYKVSAIEPYDMCCQIKWFDMFRQEFANLAREENLPRPTVSNPDLGVMSWYKQFNIIDLGMLGTPLIAKLDNGPVFSEYFFEYAAPDFIESHYYWSCKYLKSIFSDPRFRQRYQPVREHHVIKYDSCDGKEVIEGIWIRKDILSSTKSKERQLIDKLAVNLSIDTLLTELRSCHAEKYSSCIYVARTAFRFLPEFRVHGDIEELSQIFKLSRTKEYDLYLINGFRDGQAHERAINFVKENYVKKE